MNRISQYEEEYDRFERCLNSNKGDFLLRFFDLHFDAYAEFCDYAEGRGAYPASDPDDISLADWDLAMTWIDESHIQADKFRDWAFGEWRRADFARDEDTYPERNR